MVYTLQDIENSLNPKEDLVTRYANQHGIPLQIASALITQESGGKQSALSNKGAVGMAQLMPATAKELGVDPTNPEQNVEGGMRYLKKQYDKFGTWDKALAAYNAGPGAVEKYGGVPPFAETQNYVKSIMGKAGPIEATGPKTADQLIKEIEASAKDIPAVAQNATPAQPVQSPNMLQSLVGKLAPPQGSLPMAGTMFGSLGGPVGSALGAAAGTNAQDILAMLAGGPTKTMGQEFTDVGKSAWQGTKDYAGGLLINKIMTAIPGLAKLLAQKYTNWATNTNSPKVADYMAEEVGPSLTKGSMVAKNQARIDINDAAAKNFVKQANIKVDMSKIVGDPELLKPLESAINVGEDSTATRLFRKLITLGGKGEISGEEALKLKTDLWDASKIKAGADGIKPTSNELGKLMRQVAHKIGENISAQVPEYTAPQANFSNGLALREGLQKSGSRTKSAAEVIWSLIHPTSIPLVAAEHYVTSPAGASVIGSGLINGANALPSQVTPGGTAAGIGAVNAANWTGIPDAIKQLLGLQ